MNNPVLTIDDLTADQRKLTDGVLEEINTILSGTLDTRRIFSIQGSAGTGKSTVTGVLVNELSKIKIFGKYLDIVATTPTHKSLEVLKNMINNSNIPCKTIHSHLKLKISKNYKTGKTDLLSSGKEVENVDILIVDESSMVSERLFNIIREYTDMRKIKCVIYIGDPCQLMSIED